MVRTAIVAVAGAMLALAALPHPAAAGTPGQALFGSSELRSDDISLFPRWSDVLTRSETEEDDAPCTPLEPMGCLIAEWHETLDSLRTAALRRQIESVNALLNGRGYVADASNWGVDDYWATPAEFLARSGDCEDFAIAKYMSLKRLGVPAEAMRIVVLEDLILRQAHAVLAVYTDDDVLILDNQRDTVVSASAIGHYQPIYSLNEQHWWLHWR